MPQLEHYPFDMDQLQKGTFLTEVFLRESVPLLKDCDDAAYQLALLSLRRTVENVFLDRGEVVYVRCEKGALRILTDVEASPYIEKRQTHYRRALAKNTIILTHVDTTVFSPEDARAHEARLVRETRYHQAQKTLTANFKQLAVQNHT